MKSFEQLKTLESSESALAALRQHISRPTTMSDKYAALYLLQCLIRLARNESHKKAEEYAAALDEIRARTDALDQLKLQHLLLTLLGDPVRAKVHREATTISKGLGKAPPSSSGYGSVAHRPSPNPPQQSTSCFRCLKWGHVLCSCCNNQVRVKVGTSRPFLVPRPGLRDSLCSIFQINCYFPWPCFFRSVSRSSTSAFFVALGRTCSMFQFRT